MALNFDHQRNRISSNTETITINNTGSIRIPSGTTFERPNTPDSGEIRFNSTLQSFEGYVNTNWTSLGGVKDVDGNTYIIAETSTGANNNDLDFYTNGSHRLQIDEFGDFGFGDSLNKFVIKNTTGNTTIAGSLNVAGQTTLSTVDVDDLTVTGNLIVSGTTTTVSAINLSIHDNMIYLNQAIQATIIDAVGDGTNIVYTTSEPHTYTTGMIVTTSNVMPSAYNLFNETITSVTSDTFTIANSAIGSYVSGGIAYAKADINPDVGFTFGYNDESYLHGGFFRDASDNYFKVFKNYEPETDSAASIDTSHPSFQLADMQAANFRGDLVGNASTASALYTARTIEISGDITGSATAFDGSANINISAGITAGSIVNNDISDSAAIADTKLATISTSGKVLNSATTATSSNTAGAIVARDISGNISVGVITTSATDTSDLASHYYVETSSDGIIRPKSLANVRTEIVTTNAVNDAAATTVGTVTSGTWSASFGSVSGANLTNLTAGNLSGTIPSSVLGNSTLYIGTTAVSLNRSSSSLSITGITSIAMPGSTSGTITITPAAIAGTTAITIPATAGTLITTGDTGTVTSTMILDGTIVNADINATAEIADTKLATISTSGKVLNSATTATNANTANAIVARDSSGDFSAGTITAALSGNASTATTLETTRTLWGQNFNGGANVSGSLTSIGDLTGSSAITITAGGSDQNITITPSGTGYTLLNGNVGINTSTPAEKLHIGGAVRLDGTYNLDSSTATLATTSQTAIASFSVTTFGSAKVIIQSKDTITNNKSITELLIVHDGSIASATQYATVNTGANELATFDVDISGGNVRILATQNSSNSTQYKVVQTLVLE